MSVRVKRSSLTHLGVLSRRVYFHISEIWVKLVAFLYKNIFTLYRNVLAYGEFHYCKDHLHRLI